MAANQQRYYGNGRPDSDSEFTFGSVYVTDDSKDGVSEFTDYNTVQTNDFDPVGGYHPPPPPPPQTSSRRQPPPQASRRQQAPVPPPSSSQPQVRALSSRSSSRNSDMVINETGEEVFRDEHEYAIQSSGSRASSSHQEAFVSSVTQWFEESVASDEEEGRRNLVLAEKNSTGSLPEQPLDVRAARNDRDKRTRKLMFRLVLACCCLFFISMGAAVALVLMFTDALGNDDKSSRDNDLTPEPTQAPTMPTTMSPTPDELTLYLTETLTGQSSYGTTVAMDTDFLAVGSPGTASGEVSSMYNDGMTWNFIPELTGSSNSAFGAALDVVKVDDNGFLLVGAPEGGNNGEGNAQLYRFDEPTKRWQSQSGQLAGQSSTSSVPESFGTSVAVSDTLRAVVGAPDHGTQGPSAGRIYTFQYRLLDGFYQPLPMAIDEKIMGTTDNARFGSDVDITNDGAFVAVGAPGNSEFNLFQWDGSVWLKIFKFQVPSEQDFGTSVTFLSKEYVAVGAPSINGDRGIIRVFQVTSDVYEWKELPVLTGKNRGDRFGAKDTVSGHQGEFGPEVVVGTGNGAIERYDLIGNRWVRRFSVDRDPAVTAIAAQITDDEQSVFAGYGSSQEAMLYSGTERISPEPTDAPTTPAVPKVWVKDGGPFTPNSVSSNTKHGHDVALVGGYLAIGEPLGRAGELGDVVIRKRDLNWGIDDSGFAVGTLEFGFSVDAAMVGGKASIVVGAANTKDPGNQARFGSAHVYQLGVNGQWDALGDPMRPSFGVTESAGEFGSSVSIASDVLRVAVGAPSSSKDLDSVNSGRVYTFEYDGSNWQQMTAPLLGDGAGKLLGSAVALSKNGQRLLMGAPGARDGDGAIYYHTWESNEWRKMLALPGLSSGEAKGTSVAIVSDDGKRIAFGGPSYGNNQGTIQVWEESPFQTEFFTLVGNQDFIGNDGEMIGATLCGAKGRIAFGTQTGSFRVYEYVDNSWNQVATGPDLGSPVVSISMSDDGNSVAVGLENEEVMVYDFE